MKYTRKPQETHTVTFSVPWIDQPITIPDIDSMPYDLLVQMTRDDNPDPILNALPDEVGVLLASANGREVGQFFQAWGDACEKAQKESARTESIFERLIRGLS